MKPYKNQAYSFKNFKIIATMFPSESLSESEFKKLHEDVMLINQSTNLNLKYGVYSTDRTWEDLKRIYSTMYVLILYKDDKPIGSSFANYLGMIGNTACIHSGLTIISQNPGYNVLYLMETMKSYFLQKTYGAHYITAVTTIPKIVETFSFIYSKTWPSPSSNLMLPPANYKTAVELLADKYIKVHFPNPQDAKINKKRFILKTNKRESGFSERFHELSKAKSLDFNLFCQCWINYENDEDLILIAKSSLRTRIITFIVHSYWRIKMGLRKRDFNISSIFVKEANS